MDSIKNVLIKDYLNMGGKCPLFGDIIGYYFQKEDDLAWEFDIKGNFIQEISGLKLYPRPHG